jgi:type I restriction enzyme M protein
MGQYFTPRTVVEFVVDMLRPTVEDKVIDPACGSGGFLLYSLERIQKIAATRFKDQIVRRDYWKDWALRSLHGIEVNDQISRVAMMGMILHEDGHTNISFCDALDKFEDLQRVNAELKRDNFTLLMTNPPFGSNIKRVSPKAKHKYLDDYVFGKGRPSQRKEIIFIERCLDLLGPGGRMGIVLPEGVLNNPKLDDVRRFVEAKAFLDAVISLPVETFISSGAFVKASVLFLRKYAKSEHARFGHEKQLATQAALERHDEERKALLGAKRQNRREIDLFEAMIENEALTETRARLNYCIFFSAARTVGISATAQANENELPDIAEAYRLFRKENQLRFGGAI